MNPGTIQETSSDLLFKRGGLFGLVASLMLLTMQFQTTPLGLEAQNVPLTSVIALLFLPFALLKIPKSPVMTLLALFTCYVILQSLIWLVVDLSSGDSEIRFISWIRQCAAFSAGVATFVVLRYSLVFVSDRQIIRYVLWGAVPLFILSLLNIAWGAFGQEWAGDIVVAVREALVPRGYTSPMRATGLATEPSTLAGSLVVIMLPLVLFLGREHAHRLSFFALLLVTTLTFVWTFSTSGLVLLLLVLLAGVVTGPDRRMMIGVMVIFLALGISALLLFPNNQVLRHATTLALGQANISFTDRFYSTFGPFLQSFSSLTTVGYGLGGTVSHFREMIPQEVQADIIAVKWKDLPNLGTLLGRIFGETGAVGFTFFLAMIITAFRELRVALKHAGDRARFLFTARIGFLAALLSSAMIFGSFHTPYLWFWLAVIDSRFLTALNGRDEEKI